MACCSGVLAGVCGTALGAPDETMGASWTVLKLRYVCWSCSEREMARRDDESVRRVNGEAIVRGGSTMAVEGGGGVERR